MVQAQDNGRKPTTMTIENAKELIAIALDEDRGGLERLESFEMADSMRKSLKIGWSKLGATVEQVEELKKTLPELAELEKAERELEEAEADKPEETASEDQNEASPAENEASEAVAEPDNSTNAKARATAKAKKAKAEGADKVRGALTRLVESMLMDAEITYLDIIHAVLAEFPEANTSARSIASVAAGMRRKGIEVPMRRPVKAEKPAETTEEQPTEEQPAEAA